MFWCFWGRNFMEEKIKKIVDRSIEAVLPDTAVKRALQKS